MKSTFPHAVGLVLSHEGGYINHPSDPGGHTNKGITIPALSKFLGRIATVHDIRALTDVQAMAIYKADYWDRVRGDDLPPGLDYCVFDFAVNSGTGRAAKMLQVLVGVEPDGGIGPKTLAAVADYVARETLEATITQYQAKRMHYLEALPTFSTFGKGWTRRVNEVLDEAILTARG